ncbi:MAG: hypothetical protein JWO06_1948 [Bacteroidota bacterium]|nr:hypothetical protein [Bacteroidota bacterium]
MKLLLNLLFMLCALFAIGQKVEVSNPYKLPSKTNKFRIIGKNNDGIVVRLYGTEDVIDVFDESFKLVTARTIDFKNQTGLFQYITLNKAGAVIFYLSQEKKYSVLYAQPVNSKFVEIGKPVLVDTIFDKKDLVASNLRFKQSVDQSYLMVYYPYFNGSKIDGVKFISIDNALHQLYNKTIPFNRNEKELEESKSFIDNKGNAYLILKPESRMESTQYDLFRISNGGDLSMYSLITKKALFGEPSFEIDNKNGNLIFCGFYNDDKKAEEVANGFFYCSYDPANGTELKSSYIPFSTQFIAELTSRTSTEKGRLYTFNIKKTILRNDGGALIIAESFIKDTHETPLAVGFQGSYNNFRTSNIFQFNDIISFSISPDAQVQWYSVMRKKQASEDDNGAYSSFMTMNEKDKLRFMFLDDISIAGSLAEYVLTSDGKNSRDILLNQEEKEVMLLPKMGRQVAPNEVILPSYMNGMLRLAKVTF